MELHTHLLADNNISDLLSSTMESSSNGIVLVDGHDRILWLNAAAEQLTGRTNVAQRGRNLSALLPGVNTSELLSRTDCPPQNLHLLHAVGSPRRIALTVFPTTSEERAHKLIVLSDASTDQAQQTEILPYIGLDELSNAVCVTDPEGRVRDVNRRFESLLGIKRSLAINSHIGTLLDFDDRTLTPPLLGTGDDTDFSGDFLIHDGGGRPLWCSIHVRAVRDVQGRLDHSVAVLTDITRCKIHEVLNHEVLTAIARDQAMPATLELLCREVERIAPQALASIIAVDEHGLMHPLAGPNLPARYSESLDGLQMGPAVGSCGAAAWRNEVVVVADIASDPLWDGYRDIALPLGLRACWSAPIRAANGRVLGTFALYYREPREPDGFHCQLIEVGAHLCALAMEREQSQRHIHRLAHFDDLTDLPNRTLLRELSQQALDRARHGGDPLAVLFVDLDKFKLINDSLGHAAGDLMLREAAARMRSSATPVDIIGRQSSDEFILVLPDCSAEQARQRAEQLLQALAQPLRLSERSIVPSSSIGISVFPEHGTDLQTLVHRADMALSHAKQEGRACLRFYREEMDRLASQRISLHSALCEALCSQELYLCYQPQIRVGDGTLHGAEALMRWRHAQMGDISPGVFIPIAEDYGLMVDLGKWALREACRQLATWRAEGLNIPSVSVNLSPTSFHDPELPQVIFDTLALNGLSPCDLIVEVTESVLLDAHPAAIRTLHELDDGGVRVSLDDFGTGYSSLGYLRRLPVSELKLDQSFVRDLGRDPAALALTEAIAHIARSLSLSVVAEGIETPEQLSLLSAQGYEAVQGFLFTRALPGAELARWMQARVPLH